MKQVLLLPFLLPGLLLLAGCGGARRLAGQASPVVHDTLMRSRHSADSVYVYESVLSDRRLDTVYLERTRVHNRFRLLRDTVFIHTVDSFPFIRQVEVERRVRYVPVPVGVLAFIGLASLAWLIVSPRVRRSFSLSS